MKLGLGTVQFGADYGVSNSSGRTPVAEVARILEYANSIGIEVIDTAVAYGDSETVLGNAFEPNHSFRVVTKVTALAPDNASYRFIDGSVRASLGRLRVKSLYGVLLHRATDAAGANGRAVIEALAELKCNGLVQKVGVSAYSAIELETVLSNFVPDIVQLPSNAIDQRLLRSGWLSRLEAMGVEIHVRSAFLQGLLLMQPNRRHAWFTPYRDALNRFDRFCVSHRLSPLEAALGYVRQIPGSVTIVGVTRHSELKDICRAMAVSSIPPLDDYAALACEQDGLVNPSKWRLH